MEQKYSTGGARFWAAMIDGLVFLPFVIVEKHLFLSTENKVGFILWQIFCVILSCGYSVIMHTRYGQTLGKMVLKVKLVDVSEACPVTFQQAIMRDIVGIGITCVALVYFIISLQNTELITKNYDDFMSPWSFLWLLLELVTMLSNPKRRAIHDFIAHTVVVRISNESHDV
ncbi:MAG: RDD family protein [Prolixibacteraceae bacterium]|nr:RDD family protein [Prolixibacteraceae bacterium]